MTTTSMARLPCVALSLMDETLSFLINCLDLFHAAGCLIRLCGVVYDIDLITYDDACMSLTSQLLR